MLVWYFKAAVLSILALGVADETIGINAKSDNSTETTIVVTK